MYTVYPFHSDYLKRLSQLHLCFKCLKKGHNQKFCNHSRERSYCKSKNHKRALCNQSIKNRKFKIDFEQNNPNIGNEDPNLKNSKLKFLKNVNVFDSKLNLLPDDQVITSFCHNNLEEFKNSHTDKFQLWLMKLIRDPS